MLKSTSPSQSRSERDRDPREPHFCDEGPLTDDAVRGNRQDVDKIRPRHDPAEHEQHVRRTGGGDPQPLAEEHGEDDGAEQRLQRHPGDPRQRLAVAQLQILARKAVDEISVRPQLSEIERPQPASGLDANDVRRGKPLAAQALHTRRSGATASVRHRRRDIPRPATLSMLRVVRRSCVRRWAEA